MKPYLLTRAVASELIRPIFGPSGVSIGHAYRNGSGARRAPRSPRAHGSGRQARGRAALVRHLRQRVGLVHELAAARAEESRTAAAAGFALIRSCGMTVSISTEHALLDGALHAQQATRYWFSISSPTDRTRRLPGGRCRRSRPQPSRNSTSADAGEDVGVQRAPCRSRRARVPTRGPADRS